MASSPRRGLKSLTAPGTSARRWEYDVFLSFRGSDTRKGFVSHLYKELHKMRGIRTFMDDRDLERGTNISPELLRAIELSNYAIIVLSENYASSSWCLDELTQIVQRMEAGKTVLPVFYQVEPTRVKNQTGSFALAFIEHGKRFSQEKVKKWRDALTTIANTSGWASNEYESESLLVERLSQFVWNQLYYSYNVLAPREKLVGTDIQLKELNLLLAPEDNDVCFIGIWGMGGIGKTTIAQLVHDKLIHDFEVGIFLADVTKNALVDLQKKLISQVLKNQDTNIRDVYHGRYMLQNCMRNKKVLLILDDVDQCNQLEELAGETAWFGSGSRVIITTRNSRLLVEYGIERVYEVEGLDYEEALELFMHHAFRGVQFEEGFTELAKRFINRVRGLPLALKVLGKHLYNRGQAEWQSELDKTMSTIFHCLKISYDGLDRMEKMIFLDVAFFHIGKEKEQVIRTIDETRDVSCSLSGINVLVEKSLLTFDRPFDPPYARYNIGMHDLIQEMAWEIVLQESPDPCGRSRLRPKDIFHVLITNTGMANLEAIVVNSAKLVEIRCNSEAMSNMDGVRLLELNNVITISSAPICPPRFSRIIRWSLYPFMCLPQGFHAHCLTEMSMPKSKLVRLWDGRKDFPNLKIMDIGDSHKLTSTPDFTGMPKLEYLRFSRCPNLVNIHSSVAVLKRLKCLDLHFCKSIECLHSELEMDSLEELYLGHCSKLKKVPEFSEQMKTLTWLHLGGTAIKQLPSSIGNLLFLTYLNLGGTAIEQLPSSIGNLVGLTYLNLSGNSIEQLPSSIGNLVGLPDLNLSGIAIEQLPSSIGNLIGLTDLNLSGTAIKQLPSSIGNLVGLTDLNLSETAIQLLPSSIGNLVGLTYLDFRGTTIEQLPSSIGNLVSLRFLNLSGTAIEQLPSSIKNLVSLTYLNLSGCKRLCVAGWPQNHRLRCLEELDLSNCNLGEGAIPEDIGCLYSLKCLNLGGNQFVTLPASIQSLSKLRYLLLDRCEKLREFPPLPPSSRFFPLSVNVKNCTSLQRLTDPSKLSSKFANLYDFILNPLNCVRLVEDKGFLNYVRSKIVRWITKDLRPFGPGIIHLTYPASEISEWFVNKSEEAGDWLGIAFCFVWASEIPDGHLRVRIDCSSGFVNFVCLDGHLRSEHVTMFYWPRERCCKEFPEDAEAEFSFETTYYDEVSRSYKVCFNMVKKWAARWVYKQDLEDLHQRLKVLKRTHQYYGEEAVPSGSDAISDDEERNRKRQKIGQLDIESE